MKTSIVCFGLLVAVMSLPAVAAPPANVSSADQQLHSLLHREWQRHLRENPVAASLEGFHQYDDRWGDISLAAIAKSHREDKQALADLYKIDHDALSPENQLNYELFDYKLTDQIAGYKFHDYLLALNQLGGIQTSGSLTHTLRFNTEADYANWIKRLQTFDRHMDQTIALLQEGIREGMTEPKVVMKRIPHQIAAQIVKDPEKSAFYRPFKKMPDTIPAAKQAELRAAAKKAIADVVVPSFRKFQTFFNGTYLPHCRDNIAATTLPNGKAYYAYVVRHYTTTDMTPRQIHELGLKKVAEIHAEMEKIFKQIGFKGSYKEFLHYLRTNPRFYYKDPKDLLEAYRAAAKRVDPELVKFFPIDLLPRVTYGVRPIPASLAPDTYPAYSVEPAGDGSVAGYMAVNLYKPEERPKYDIQVLTCHEGRPGHQLQIPISQELKNVPNFRRFSYINAFGEGWALYSETLCDDMGLYDNPYSRFGYLDYQMWRAVRLVVDTGMHQFGWSRERAIKYFEANTALSVENLTNEVDRYIAWPGQALAYMIGEMTIQDLRQQAQKALGSKFDIRAFNGVVLEHGTLPMKVLRHEVDQWIQQQKAKAGKA
ncbi:MAG TPA: DUF885 domain-containing protein [Gammaproteobacteria bacterium]|nr:DUF885 domain-containing protein [Gammaproteobacteria bacterium]